MPGLLTVGHSNHDLDHFIQLLKQHHVQCLVDVRSHPASKFASQFNQSSLERAVKRANIDYVFMGEELGGRPRGEDFYDGDGFVLYWRRAESEQFLRGVERLTELSKRWVVAMMCSEENPKDCHRRLLIGEVLKMRGLEFDHIRGDGSLEPESFFEETQAWALFDEPKENEWKSARSVLRKEPLETSSEL